MRYSTHQKQSFARGSDGSPFASRNTAKYARGMQERRLHGKPSGQLTASGVTEVKSDLIEQAENIKRAWWLVGKRDLGRLKGCRPSKLLDD